MRFIYSKHFLLFCASLVGIVIAVFLDTRGLIWPLRETLVRAPQPAVSAASSVARPVKGFFGTVFRLRQIVTENSLLQDRVRVLGLDLAELDQARLENEALRKEIGFAKASPLKLTPCSVIGRSPLGLQDAVSIGCGTDDGAAEGKPVLSGGFLVGKISYAGKKSSTVLLMTSARFSVDAKLSKTSLPGLVGGSFGTGVTLDRLSQNEPVEKGALVVTAGLSSLVPRSIPIGEVGDVLSGPNDLFKKTSIVSPVDFSDLKFTFIASEQ